MTATEGTGIRNRKDVYAAIDVLVKSDVVQEIEQITGGYPHGIYRIESERLLAVVLPEVLTFGLSLPKIS